MSERRKKRRALLLALLSTGLLTLFFLLLVWTPPPKTPKPTGYLLVEFGPGGQNLPPRPAAPKPPAVEKPVMKAPPKKPAAPKPKAAKPEVKKPAPKPKPPSVAKKPLAKAPLKKPAAPKPKAAKTEVKKPSPKPKPKATKAPPKSLPTPEPEAPKPQAAAPAAHPKPLPELEPPALALPEAPAVAKTPAAELAPKAPSELKLSAAKPAVEKPPEALESTAQKPPVEPAPPAEAPVAATPVAAEAPAPALSEAPPAPALPEAAPAPPAGEFPGAPAPPSLAEGPAPPTPQPGPKKGGAKGQGAGHYEVRISVPLLISVDNAHAAFPQTGFALAARVYEVPVEGGVTRLLFETWGGESGRVGPVRSARLYMLDLADVLGAFLVHVGGSPLAQKRIEDEGFVTFDGLYDRDRFSRDPKRNPPHNAYADLGKVRAELRRLGLDKSTLKKGAPYLPPEDAPPGKRLSVRYAPDYQSAFRYEGGRYRWYRNGRATRVRVDAVAVLFVKARVKDEVGRLELALTQGEGALYLEGRYQPVRWRFKKGGFELSGSEGKPLDLTPYRVWYLLVPPWAKLE